MQVRGRVSHSPQRRSPPFLRQRADHLRRHFLKSMTVDGLAGVFHNLRQRIIDVRTWAGTKRVIRSRVARLRPHVVEQQVAVDRRDLIQLRNMTRRAADLRKQLLPFLECCSQFFVFRRRTSRSRQRFQIRDQLLALGLREIKSCRLILWPMWHSGLNMIGHMQPQFDGTRRDGEVVKIRLLRLPAELPDPTVFQPSHSATHQRAVGMPFLSSGDQDLVRNRIE